MTTRNEATTAARPLHRMVVRLACWWFGCRPDYDAMRHDCECIPCERCGAHGENARICQASGDQLCTSHWNAAIARLECLEADDTHKKALGPLCVATTPTPTPLPTVSAAPRQCYDEYQNGIKTTRCPM